MARGSIIVRRIAVLLLALFVLASCVPKVAPEPQWEKDARALLDQADLFYAKKQYDQSGRTVDAFLNRYPKSRYLDRAFYLAGEVRLALRDYPRALSYYKEVIEKFPSSSFIIDAKYKLGLCYFEVKDYDSAIANLEDRSKITDPLKLRRAAETLSAAYVIRKNYLRAIKEYVYLEETATDARQKAGYHDRVRETIDKSLNEDELKTLSSGTAYPADAALLRLAALYMEQRKYHEAVKTSKDFLDRYPAHPEKTRAEMISVEATARLTAPRYFVGALVPQSGQLAFFGDRVLKGIQLAVHTYNLQEPDSRVELLVKDTEGSPEKAVAGLADLASKGIVAAIGPITTKEVEALMPALEKYKVPVIRPAASRSGLAEKSSWVFTNALTIDSQAATAAQYAQKLRLRKFVVLYPDEPYGKDLSRLFVKELARKSEVLANISYPPETNDFGPYVRRIIEIDLRSRRIPIPEDDAERKKLFQEYTPSFDGLYLPGYAERVGLLIPQLAFYNITGMTIIGSDNWHSAELIERAGRHAEGAVFVDGFFPESIDASIRSFVDAYRSAYQEEPDILSAQAYDAAMMVFSLIKGHRDTPAAVRDGLSALKDFPGVSGSTTFAGSGEAQKKLFLIKIADGRFTLATN